MHIYTKIDPPKIISVLLNWKKKRQREEENKYILLHRFI